MKLVYLPTSLEISRANWGTDDVAMWNVYGANHYAFPDGTTITLPTVKNIRKFGLIKAAYIRLQEAA